MKLVGGEVQISVRCHGHCVRPKYSRIVDNRLPITINLSLTNAVVFIIASVDTAFVITFKTVRRALFSQIDAIDAEVRKIMQKSLDELKQRSGPKMIVKVKPRVSRGFYPNARAGNIPQWELVKEKQFSIMLHGTIMQPR